MPSYSIISPKNLLLLMPKNIRPDIKVKSINRLKIDDLKKKGIKNIIFDVDHTLTAYHGSRPSILIKEQFENMKDNFNCAALTNFIFRSNPAYSREREKEVENNFGIPCTIPESKKPDKKAFEQAMRKNRFRKEETAIIGDRLLTDIAGGNNYGIMTIQVNELHKETMPLIYRFLIFFEKAIYKIYKLLGLV